MPTLKGSDDVAAWCEQATSGETFYLCAGVVTHKNVVSFVWAAADQEEDATSGGGVFLGIASVQLTKLK